MSRLFALCALMLLPLVAENRAATVVFLTPDKSASGQPPAYVPVSDPAELARFEKWLQIPSAQMAVDLYTDAREAAIARGLAKNQPKLYHIALEEGGNYPAVGLRVRRGKSFDSFPDAGFIKLDPSEDFFRSTLIHETGHVAAAMLNGGRMPRAKPMASLPHSNAALTDRVTAFNEGFGIHLETVAAHIANDPAIRSRYNHEQFLFGPGAGRRSEYSHAAFDLMNFAQVTGRYYDVRENTFAFESAFQQPDYARVQYEKARDFATLRDANQLLQSEGFYATFFFSLVARGEAVPSRDVVRQREKQLLEALADMFEGRQLDAGSPFLLYFVESYTKRFPEEKEQTIDILLDLSHAVFVDSKAQTLWRDYYLAALNLDLEKVRSGAIENVRKAWHDAVVKDPAILYSRLGPQIRCTVEGVDVGLVAFQEKQPLAFDINTVQPGIIRMIPGISDAEAARWLDQRSQKPFATAADFRTRSGLSRVTLQRLTLNE